VHYAVDRTKFATEGTTVRYQIDTRSSTFKIRAFAAGLLSAFGHSPTIAIRDFSGEVQLDPDTLESGAVHLRIKASSLAVADDISDKDRREIERQMYENVLEISQYPEIAYEGQSASISKAANGSLEVSLQGELTLHGVTQPQAIMCRAILMGDSLRASGEFSISQRAYSIKEVNAVGGTIRLKDELKGAFEIMARKRA
jgi:polyisoprenoid-binding protein YceI